MIGGIRARSRSDSLSRDVPSKFVGCFKDLPKFSGKASGGGARVICEDFRVMGIWFNVASEPRRESEGLDGEPCLVWARDCACEEGIGSNVEVGSRNEKSKELRAFSSSSGLRLCSSCIFSIEKDLCG